MLDFGFYNEDCLPRMKEYPDNFFDLAVVDPPYGDAGGGTDCRPSSQFTTEDGAGTPQKSRGGGGTGSVNASTGTRTRHYTFGLRKKDKNYENRRHLGREICKKIIAWDVAPGQEYFDELFRISRNQIIWGGNYFSLPPTRCFLIWRKLSISESFSMAMCEYAWTSFNSNAKMFEYTPQGRPGDNRFHPTQKPVALYEWLLNRYAKPGDTILDTHVGSASSLIACRNTNHKYVGFEIDETYYALAKDRLDRESAQMNIFDFIERTTT